MHKKINLGKNIFVDCISLFFLSIYNRGFSFIKPTDCIWYDIVPNLLFLAMVGNGIETKEEKTPGNCEKSEHDTFSSTIPQNISNGNEGNIQSSMEKKGWFSKFEILLFVNSESF